MFDHEYSLTFEKRDGYLYAYLTGTESFTSGLGYWNEIAEEIFRQECDRLLVHKNMQGTVSGAEVYDILREVVPAAKGIKVAFFDENKSHSMINRFALLLARNKGVNARILPSLKEAQNWITAD